MRIAVTYGGVRLILQSDKIIVDTSKICVYEGEYSYTIAELSKDDVELAFDNALQNGYADMTHFTAVKNKES